MKSCPKCGELNGNNSMVCFKCGARIGTSAEQAYQKICPKCGHIYHAKQEYCPDCPDTRLSRYEPSVSSGNSTAWMYIVGFLLPLVGIVLGIVYIARGEEDTGKPVLLFSVFAPMAVGIVLAVLAVLIGMA